MNNTTAKTGKESPLIRENVNLKSLNTLGVEALAGQFVEIHHTDQLRYLYKKKFFDRYDPVILGGGSNILFLNNTESPVVKVSIAGYTFKKLQNGKVLVSAGAGENWHQLVKDTVDKNIGGIENLALIPGTVGAAPIQNIGAYGVELKDCFHELTAFMMKSGELKTFKAEDCNFGYRNSIFKRELKGEAIVCDVTLRLTQDNYSLNLNYKGIAEFLDSANISNPDIHDIFNAVVAIRRSKLPDPSDYGNAGSFFKNPILDSESYARLKKKYPEVPSYKLNENEFKIPAAWLIDQAGWKGRRIGNVGTYKNQALVIVNHGDATGEEIYNHAKTIQKSVLDMFDVDLQPEVNIVGKRL